MAGSVRIAARTRDEAAPTGVGRAVECAAAFFLVNLFLFDAPSTKSLAVMTAAGAAAGFLAARLKLGALSYVAFGCLVWLGASALLGGVFLGLFCCTILAPVLAVCALGRDVRRTRRES